MTPNPSGLRLRGMNRRGFLKSLAAAAMTVAARAYSTTEPAALPAQDVPRTIRTRLPPVKWRKIDVEYIESMNREFAELVFYGDWRELFRYVERIEAVSKDDIKRVIGTTLVPANRTIGRIETIEQPPAASAAGE